LTTRECKDTLKYSAFKNPSAKGQRGWGGVKLATDTRNLLPRNVSAEKPKKAFWSKKKKKKKKKKKATGLRRVGVYAPRQAFKGHLKRRGGSTCPASPGKGSKGRKGTQEVEGKKIPCLDDHHWHDHAQKYGEGLTERKKAG